MPQTFSCSMSILLFFFIALTTVYHYWVSVGMGEFLELVMVNQSLMGMVSY